MSDQVQSLELGNYRVLNKDDGSLWLLGRGSYGTTYKGEHRHLRRVCALKVINEHLVRNDEAKVRFLQEAQAAASLDHGHIARIYDFGEENGLFYYAMSYCAGGDLEQFAGQRGPQRWDVVADFARQIFSALAEAHGQGLLHRDIKPSNVMLVTDTQPPSLRLIDFGLVKALDEDDPGETATMRTREGAFMGNPLTASPEQFREEALDERSDLYSAGITLWYLLVGGSPFGKASSAEIAKQRLSVEDYGEMLPADLPAEGQVLLNRLLATDREQRYRNAAEVLAALEGGVVPSQPGGVDESLEESWAVEGVVRQFEYGSYYRCRHQTDLGVPPATLFIPESGGPDYDQVLAAAERMTAASAAALCGFRSGGLYDQSRAFLCDPLPAGSFPLVLEQAGRLRLAEDSKFLADVALAFDEALAQGVEGLELGDSEIPVGVDPAVGTEPANEDEWKAFLAGTAGQEGGATFGVRPRLLPRLAVQGGAREASATIGGDDLATNPLARFGAFLYRVLSGMSVKPSAYLTPLDHVSFSDISEESNRYLADVIAGRIESGSAGSVLQHLRELEGCESSGAADSRVTVSPSMSRPLSPPAGVLPPGASQTKTLPPQATHPAATHPAATHPAATHPAATHPAATANPPQASQSGQVISAAATAASVAGTVGQPMAGPVAVSEDKPSRWWKRRWVGGAVAGMVVMAGGLFLLTRENDSGDGSTAIDSPVETGSGTLKFPQFELTGSLPQDVELALADPDGTRVGELRLGDGGATVADFPLELFEQAGRWPLSFMVLDRRFLASGPKLERSAFAGRDGSTPSCADAIRLRVNAYADVPVKLRAGGQPLDDWVPLMDYLLVGGDLAAEVLLSPEGQLRVLLPPGQSFPVSLDLQVPSIKAVDFELEPGAELAGDLRLETRSLELNGIGTQGLLRFEPDLAAVEETAMREIYRQLAGNPEAEVREILTNGRQWRLPKLPGSIVFEKQGRAGRVLLTFDAKFLVFVDLAIRLDEEPAPITSKRQVAERGNIDAQYEVAELYKEYAKEQQSEVAERFAFGWYELAALRGDRTSQFNLGVLYRDGFGTQRNPTKAAQWYLKAANNGYSSAMSEYGLCLLFGKGVEKNEQEAMEWFRKCAEEGNPLGMNNLGLTYGDQESPLYDPEQSLLWFTKSAEIGNAEGMFYLGFCYQNGLGTPVDTAKAREWFEKASKKGNQKAASALENMGS